MEVGRIIKIVSNQYMVLLSNGEILECVAMGKLRKDKAPVVGDQVEVQRFESQNGIQKILERKNELIRPRVANVDQAIIVMSACDPDFSTSLVDRLIFLISCAGITPVLCVSKLDLVSQDDPVYAYIEDYRKSGYQVFETGHGVSNQELKQLLAGKISVLTGQSGAGKSSLINRLDASFKLQTQQISKALGRGKHTTRHCELMKVCDGWIADTPGFSSLDFSHISIEQLAASIPDFKQVQGMCRFQDCRHLKEPDCALRKCVEQNEISRIRYEHYVEVCEWIMSQKVKYR